MSALLPFIKLFRKQWLMMLLGLFLSFTTLLGRYRIIVAFRMVLIRLCRGRANPGQRTGL